MPTEREMLYELNRFYTLWREINVLYENWAKQHGLSLNSLLMLYSFYENNTVVQTQKDISQKWVIPKQTVHDILKDFETKQYVTLVPSVQDRRHKTIQLTEKGRVYTKEIMTELRRLELNVIEQMGFGTMTELNQHLTQFAHLFSKKGQIQ
ncbi:MULTISPECIES: MarR family winged helix-turn-helix transcriptional regulator [unclassified Granulicatella]|uniref:MarR family winged helix-turn-helix transcriptional regulator n=1 Tax=unclassified Granulicatella TaxID=2630493 RepID=UPI001073DBE7|nr:MULTISPECIES: MarR family winged helix-turn-helix transcriptional regulator [unclassified Granulicatella]MBF0780928.1 winged helix-turn-helix transcriptional regulator [Granulicatella sp. 19428wC4_WM01]TFU93206.1 MarR family transcriptional regulator [Granulicatella sp. WM01]